MNVIRLCDSIFLKKYKIDSIPGSLNQVKSMFYIISVLNILLLIVLIYIFPVRIIVSTSFAIGSRDFRSVNSTAGVGCCLFTVTYRIVESPNSVGQLNSNNLKFFS